MAGGANPRGSIGGASLSVGVGGSGSGSGAYMPPGPSETDGETLDNFTDDFGEFDEWNYQEMLENVYVRALGLSWAGK